VTKVAVVTDSTADLPAGMINNLGIHVVPVNIEIEGEVYQDRVTISPQEFMHRLTTSNAFPTTSEPSPGRFLQLYYDLAGEYDQIVSVHISARLSGTYQSACQARDLMTDGPEIHVIDSATASMGTGFLTIHAARLAREGATATEIVQAVNGMQPRIHVAFLVDTLEYLRRGGRIGRAAEILGSVVRLKPILRIEEGIIVPHARTRNRRRAMARMVELVDEIPQIAEMALLYAAGTDDIGRLASRLTPRVEQDSLVMSELSPMLSAHLGPKAIAVVIREAEPEPDVDRIQEREIPDER
jgi:DegV family protein with EDD domain